MLLGEAGLAGVGHGKGGWRVPGRGSEVGGWAGLGKLDPSLLISERSKTSRARIPIILDPPGKSSRVENVALARCEAAE